MQTVGIAEFKAKCIKLLKEAQQTGEPLLVTRRGEPLARIVPVRNESTPRQLGTLARETTIVTDLTSLDFTDDWEITG